MSRSGPWRVLGIAATDDAKAIRRAYADKLRAMDLDRDAAGYAALRQARDMALYLAREQAAGQIAEPEDLQEDHAVPVPVADGEVPTRAEPEDAPEFDDQPLPDPEQTAGPDVELAQVLFPGGEYSQEPLTDEEWARADAALGQIVGDVHGGELVRQHAADMWVADCLARAWPRSSMLLERAAAAFDWEKDRGQIHEGRAQAFLNGRLRGMRFLAELEKPGHWGHNAWSELSKPGTKGLLGRFRANSHEIRTLLSTIRENFPELEAYLHQEKVQSWDQPVGSPWFGTGSIIVTVFLALQLVGMCSRVATTAYEEREAAPPIMIAGPQLEERRDEIAQRVFGPETDFAFVEAHSPTLGGAIAAYGQGEDDSEADGLVRRWIFVAARTAQFDQLVRIQQLKLDLALLARRWEGGAACAMLLETGQLPAGTVPADELRQREQSIARELLQAGAFREPVQSSQESRASVPTPIFSAAQRASGLPLEKAREVATGGGDPDERCRFQTALMAEVLRQPGRVDVDLLRIL